MIHTALSYVWPSIEQLLDCETSSMLLYHVTLTSALLQANAESHVEIQISDDSRHAHFDFHRFAPEYPICRASDAPCMLFAELSLLCAYNLTAKIAPRCVSLSMDFF